MATSCLKAFPHTDAVCPKNHTASRDGERPGGEARLRLKSWSPAAASGAAGQGAKGGLGTQQGSALLWAENRVQLKNTKTAGSHRPSQPLFKANRSERQDGSWGPHRGSPPAPRRHPSRSLSRQESVATSRSPSSAAGSAVGNPRPGSGEGWEGGRGSPVLNSPTKLGSSRWPTGGERSPAPLRAGQEVAAQGYRHTCGF